MNTQQAVLPQIQEAANTLTSMAKKASNVLSQSSNQEKNEFLTQLSATIKLNTAKIIAANTKDLKNAAKQNLSAALIDRLTLNSQRINAIANGVLEVAALPDPIGEVILGKKLRGGVEMLKKKVPLGVVLVIFESRPNVTIDIAALCIKSGNACILKGGKEANHSNSILCQCIAMAAEKISFPKECVQLVEGEQKAIVANLLTRNKEIDVVVPRGGSALIKYVQSASAIPVICHDAGICNLYIHSNADEKMSNNIAVNAKAQRPGVCNAVENILLHQNYPHKESLCNALLKAGVEVRLHENILKQTSTWQTKTFPQASEEDFTTEYLDLIVSIKLVKSTEEACQFINQNGSHHTDAIVCSTQQAANTFENMVDSSCVAINTSTRYHDGGVFGFGSEVGTSTQKLHVRGTMCASDLCTTKYVLRGNGQVRSNF